MYMRILTLTVFPGSRRPEHLQRMLHAAHRLLEDDLPQREVQQRQVARLHQPHAAVRRRRRAPAVDQ